MRVFVDSEFKCHTDNPDGVYLEAEHEFFDGKCAAFIEGHRFVPSGFRWERADGVVFDLEMIAPWKDPKLLEIAQREYEREMIAEYESLINELYSEVTAE